MERILTAFAVGFLMTLVIGAVLPALIVRPKGRRKKG